LDANAEPFAASVGSVVPESKGECRVLTALTHILANLVLVIHFAFVAFVVGGLAAIWIGAAAGWRWVRNFRFRVIHLAAIVFVAAEALVGVMCPLTVWEDALRGRESDTGFIARWIHGVMFYQLPPWVFTTAYLSFAVVVALTFWAVPPARRSGGSGGGARFRERSRNLW
jgi:hypothetical protein